VSYITLIELIPLCPRNN